MSLGKLQEYLYLWQLPFIGVFLFGWIVGGGYMLRRSVRKALPEMRKRIRLGRCVLVSILSGFTALATAVAVFMLVSGLGTKIEADLTIVAIIVAIPIAGLMAVLSVYATFHLSLLQSARVLAPTAGAVLLLGGVIGSITGTMAYRIHTREVRERTALDNALRVGQALSDYEERALALPGDLQTLVTDNYLTTRYVRSPNLPGRDVGFFYYPTEWSPGDLNTRKILLCELPPALPANRRAVMYVNGSCILAGEEELRGLFDRPENAEFVKAFQAATGSGS